VRKVCHSAKGALFRRRKLRVKGRTNPLLFRGVATKRRGDTREVNSSYVRRRKARKKDVLLRRASRKEGIRNEVTTWTDFSPEKKTPGLTSKPKTPFPAIRMGIVTLLKKRLANGGREKHSSSKSGKRGPYVQKSFGQAIQGKRGQPSKGPLAGQGLIGPRPFLPFTSARYVFLTVMGAFSRYGKGESYLGGEVKSENFSARTNWGGFSFM